MLTPSKRLLAAASLTLGIVVGGLTALPSADAIGVTNAPAGHWTERPVVRIPHNFRGNLDLDGTARLDVLYSQHTVPARYSNAWGGDRSVEWAHQDCLDSGGKPRWVNGKSYRLRCQGVDY